MGYINHASICFMFYHNSQKHSIFLYFSPFNVKPFIKELPSFIHNSFKTFFILLYQRIININVFETFLREIKSGNSSMYCGDLFRK